MGRQNSTMSHDNEIQGAMQHFIDFWPWSQIGLNLWDNFVLSNTAPPERQAAPGFTGKMEQGLVPV